MNYKLSQEKHLLFLATFFCIISCKSDPNSTHTSTRSNSVDTQQSLISEYKTQKGEKIFQDRCITCHGLSGNQRELGAADLQLSRLDSIGIIQTIKNGKGRMPPFFDAIPDSDLVQVVEYVKSLRQY